MRKKPILTLGRMKLNTLTHIFLDILVLAIIIRFVLKKLKTISAEKCEKQNNIIENVVLNEKKAGEI